jgi:hypothetical protein
MKAVIVLGSGVGLDGAMGTDQKLQVEKARDLVDSGQADVIITCGLYGYKADQKPVMSEAQAFKNYALSIGVPEEKILIENESLGTVSNMLFAKTRILMPNNWTKFFVIPGPNHTDERVQYITQKVFGPGYTWIIARASINDNPENNERERRSLELTKQTNDLIVDGDHEAVWDALRSVQPAYNVGVLSVPGQR